MQDKIDIKRGGKVVILIHGFPEPIYKDSDLYKYFDSKGYSIIAPYLFSSKFKLTQEDVEKHIEKELSGRVPSVIVGVSMGGLVAPALAKKYPHAKLVLIGTGPYIKPNVKSMNELLRIGKTPVFDVVYKALHKMPTPIYAFFYRLFNHPALNEKEKIIMERHIIQNWNCIKRVSESEDREVIDFLSSVDNTILLKSLKNKTLIFGAGEDNLMPPMLSKKLNTLIKNSKLIISPGKIHYTVFDQSNYQDLFNFLLD